MRNFFFFILFFAFLFDVNAQIKEEYVQKISNIICDCLNSNKSKSDRARLDECTNVLLEGLSVIRSNEIKELYAQKTDTYLQRSCYEYIKIIYNNAPKSDVQLSSKDEFISFSEESKISIDGLYSYRNYLGEEYLVEINERNWIEKSSISQTSLLFHLSEDYNSLIFKNSNNMFFSDFFKPNDNINIITKINGLGKMEVILDYGNDIYIKKVLTKR